MSMRYDDMFNRLGHEAEGAFVPFVTIGDPGYELSLKIIDTLVKNGADALELGIPFSDPLADGPVIQEANLRALNAGTTPSHCLEIIREIRSRYAETPIGLLLYANIAYANGINNFYKQAAAAGVDSVLLADVPVEEAAPFNDAAIVNSIAPVLIVPPNIDMETLKQICKQGSGYTYLLSRAGVTGTETEAGMPTKSLLEALDQFASAPPLLGFGIAEPAQVTQAISAGAAGVISGSAVVKIIAKYHDDEPELLDKLAEFVRAMKQASHRSESSH